MITNTGKGILTKYLIGQANAYASYIAIGCGPKPLNQTDQFGDYSEKVTLGFETYRAPIVSRGYVIEDGVSKVVFTADLPSEERYEITEVGIFPAANNSIAGNSDSRILSKFNVNEGWVKNGLSAIGLITIGSEQIIHNATPESVFHIYGDDTGLARSERITRQERPRFLNDTIVVKGGSTDYIQWSTKLDLSNNSPSDLIKLAFSVLSNNSLNTTSPGNVLITLDFLNSDGKKATLLAGVGNSYNTVDPEGISRQIDFSNRYVVYTEKIQNLTTDSGFDFRSIIGIKVSVSVTGSSGSSVPSDYYVALDGLRLENVSSGNALYGLVGYSPIRNSDGSGSAIPIVKDANTSNFVEFRFNVGV